MNKIADNFYVGIVAGLIGAFIGTLLFYLSQYSHASVLEYYRIMWFGGLTGPIISIGAILNLLVFSLFYRFEKYNMARGVIASMFFLVVVVLILKFV